MKREVISKIKPSAGYLDEPVHFGDFTPREIKRALAVLELNHLDIVNIYKKRYKRNIDRTMISKVISGLRSSEDYRVETIVSELVGNEIELQREVAEKREALCCR